MYLHCAENDNNYDVHSMTEKKIESIDYNH